MTPNPSLEPTRYGRRRLAAPGHWFSLSFRGQSAPASAGGSARTLGLAVATPRKHDP